MDLFNKSGVLVASALVLVGALIAHQAKVDAIPSPTVVEQAVHSMDGRVDGAANRRLEEWAALGSPVAQRELALRYLSDPAKQGEGMRLLKQAARAGDAQAVRGLSEGYADGETLSGAARIGDIGGLRLLKEAGNSNYALH
ncbi:hypothetical protein [Rugamonas apoptosis]|uniref:Sel1 repeat family protein n=1 Tax=Rugamonas apoptosis TaxID=2758570 RepID=A0A7W2F900_9BURK|nr:hypothetical protein [Rugamonas apoptosis]MBA5687254.1 hypothetical protein [Rugamonas apoptosis]